FRERINGRPLRVPFPAAQRVGVDRNEQGGLTRTRELHAIAERHEGVVAAGHEHAVLAGLFELVAQEERELQHDALLHLPARRPGAVIDAAVAGIDDDEWPRIAVAFGLRRRFRLTALEREAAHKG